MRRTLRLTVDYLAPILLVAIALLQIYRAHTVGQSAWKGGGFGMFSTVDSPGSRYVRTYIVTADGADLEVPIPTAAYRAVQRLRVIPSQHRLDQIAQATAGEQWLWNEYDPVRRLEESVGDPTVSLPAAVPPAAGESERPLDQPRVRAARSGEPVPPEEARVEIAAARVELWRLRFDGATGRLSSRLILSATYSPSAETGPQEAIRVALR